MELKNGETYNGHLVCCDSWMNINLREVICTSRVSEHHIIGFPHSRLFLSCIFLQDGDKFWRMPECYIRGITIKYIRIPDEVIDMMKEDMVMKNKARGDGRPGRGAPGQRGRNAPRGSYFVCIISEVNYFVTW